jgi:hypothetical protein
VKRGKKVGRIPLFLNRETYAGDLHASIGTAIENGLENDEYDVFDLDPDYMIPEGSYHESRLIAEDWLFVDEDAEDAIFIQGKSYKPKTELTDSEINQVDAYRSYLSWRAQDIEQMLNGGYVVHARAAGVKDPGEDFAEMEEGIRDAVMSGEELKIYADVYEIEASDKEISGAFQVFSE